MDATSITWIMVCQLLLGAWAWIAGPQAFASPPESSSLHRVALFRPDRRDKSGAATSDPAATPPDSVTSDSQAQFRPLRKRHIAPGIDDRPAASAQSQLAPYGYPAYGSGGLGGMLPYYSPTPLTPVPPMSYPQAPLVPAPYLQPPYTGPLQSPYVSPPALLPSPVPPLMTPLVPPGLVTPYNPQPWMSPYGWGIR